MANNNGEFLQRLKEHLRKLFQLDFGELDFGIYRIMNYKRKEIENFIEKDLIETVEKEFEQYKTSKKRKNAIFRGTLVGATQQFFCKLLKIINFSFS